MEVFGTTKYGQEGGSILRNHLQTGSWCVIYSASWFSGQGKNWQKQNAQKNVLTNFLFLKPDRGRRQ